MKAKFFLVMGVSGCGKSTLGKALADQLGWQFFDADDFHPVHNIAKMAAGIPLDDDDRRPWLADLHQLISSCLSENRGAVLACSALKERYRQVLLAGTEGVQIVFLKGSYELIWSRMLSRAGHYMKPAMLQSQFAALEEPAEALVVDVSTPLAEAVGLILGAQGNP